MSNFVPMLILEHDFRWVRHVFGLFGYYFLDNTMAGTATKPGRDMIPFVNFLIF
jgi:hypothetical protein